MASSSSFPDYYKVLDVSHSASDSEIRQAYKKQSLLTHPDRQKNASEAQRQKATEKFQLVADAYYVLSDQSRRRAYDNQRSSRSSFPGGYTADNSDSASANFFSQFFGKNGAGAPFAEAYDDTADDTESESSAGSGGSSRRPDAEYVFTDVFEELLTPEVERVVPFWRWAGAASGAVMGFIVGNLPGAAIGGYAGGKIGSIRDAKGKAVATVFSELGGDQKAAIIAALMKKVLGSVTG